MAGKWSDLIETRLTTDDPLSNATTSFDLAVRDILKDVGYTTKPLGLNLASVDPVVRTAVEKSSLQFGDVTVYTLFVGDVSFRRAYSVSAEGNVQPESTMQAKGIDVSRLRQDDSFFVTDLPAPTREPLDDDVNLTEVTSPPTVSALANEESELGMVVISSAPDRLQGPARSNLALATKGLLVVAEAQLTFENDSLVLGDENKRRVRTFVRQFNESSDKFTVLGCASGSGKNEDKDRLALGRSERVRSELLYAGVPSTRIVKEECNSAQAFEYSAVPPRTVLLTLVRRSS